jgi:hypothetical protein
MEAPICGVMISKFNLPQMMVQITTSEYHFQLLRIIQFLKLKYIQFVLSKLSISMIKTMIQTK